MAAQKLVCLKLPCKPPEARTAHGKQMLKRFAEGRHDDPRSVPKFAETLSPQECSILQNYQTKVDDMQAAMIEQCENEQQGDDDSELEIASQPGSDASVHSLNGENIAIESESDGTDSGSE